MSKKKPDPMERIAAGLERFLALEEERAKQFGLMIDTARPLFQAAIDHLTEEFLKAYHGR